MFSILSVQVVIKVVNSICEYRHTLTICVVRLNTKAIGCSPNEQTFLFHVVLFLHACITV